MTLHAYTRRVGTLEQLVSQEKNRPTIPTDELREDVEYHLACLKGASVNGKKALALA